MTHVPVEVLRGSPCVWINSGKAYTVDAGNYGVTTDALNDAVKLLSRSAPLLTKLFPELHATGGVVDSPLHVLGEGISAAIGEGTRTLLVKADHELPLTGTIKARGGMFEVLTHALRIATEHRLIGEGGDLEALASPAARRLFGARTIVVGSTGNLGFAVGLIATRLGFNAEVHMSRDAKAWKKDRLEGLGVRVVEHRGDFTQAVTAARASVVDDPMRYMVDDECSTELFLGYAAAGFEVAGQISGAGIEIGPERRLAVYLPCGVGGAAGGITFALKAIFGSDVDCVLVEPVQSPSMLIQLASGSREPVSVYDFGLTNRTRADGLAVGQASLLVARSVGHLVDAVVTVTDDELYSWAAKMWNEASLRLEPSSAAGFAAVAPFVRSAPHAEALRRNTVHMVWTTGGALLPDDEFQYILGRADEIGQADRATGMTTERGEP